MRQLLTISIILLYSPQIYSQVCGIQDYDDPDNQPNFECPSPGETALVPDLNPPSEIPIFAGQIIDDVPWDGAMIHRDRMIELGLKIMALRRLRWADRINLARQQTIQLQHAQELSEIRSNYYQIQLESLQEQLQHSQNRANAWYRSWWFGVVVGIVSSGFLVFLTAYSLHAISI